MAVIEAKAVLLKNLKEVCIRTPVAEDAERVLNYMKKIFEEDRFFLMTAEEAKEWQTLEKEQEHIQKYHTDEDKLIVISETDGRILSLSSIECGSRQRMRHIGQVGISILPDWRGLGLGKAIMEVLIEWARAHPKLEKLALGVWSGNKPAIRLYQKMGFIEEGRKIREVKYADGSYDDMICMYRMVDSK